MFSVLSGNCVWLLKEPFEVFAKVAGLVYDFIVFWGPSFSILLGGY